MNQKIRDAMELMVAGPSVSPSEASNLVLKLADRLDTFDIKAMEALCEIAGVAAVCEHPDMTRKFIKHVAINGPIA